MSVMLANGGSKDRKFSDFYPTPADVTMALLARLSIPKTERIWEPACGDGHMVRAMESAGYERVWGTDIREGKDFLDSHPVTRPEWIITNPPFSLSSEFIRHCKRIEPRSGFALLLKSQYWHASKRLQLFRDIRPSIIYPLTWRPDFLFGAKSGAPTMEVMWCVWEYPYDAKHTIYQPIEKTFCTSTPLDSGHKGTPLDKCS